MNVRDLSQTFVSAIEGVDIDDLSDVDVRDIRDLLYTRKVVVIEGQKKSRSSFQSFASRFGALEAFKLKNYHDSEYPYILILNNLNKGQSVGARKLGNMWHSDSSYLATPLALTFLHAQTVPDGEGDTLFVDMEAALVDLPRDLKDRVVGRCAEHDVRWTYKVREADVGESVGDIFARLRDQFAAQIHPTTVHHPVTGKEALYVSPGYSTRLVGYDDEQSRSTMDAVYGHLFSPGRVFAHRWKPDDLLIWDNRSVIHCASPLPDDADRVMHRIGVNDREFFGRAG